jgi:hypothetical protein
MLEFPNLIVASASVVQRDENGALPGGSEVLSARPIEKTRDRFPGAGFENSCDGEDMPVICPTCQIFI